MICQACDGMGTRTSMPGHCFDIDGGRWHDVGGCKAPEHPGSNCCPPCVKCDGTGQVSIGSLTCHRCEVTVDLGKDEDGAMAVMDRFFVEHGHEART